MPTHTKINITKNPKIKNTAQQSDSAANTPRTHFLPAKAPSNRGIAVASAIIPTTMPDTSIQRSVRASRFDSERDELTLQVSSANGAHANKVPTTKRRCFLSASSYLP